MRQRDSLWTLLRLSLVVVSLAFYLAGLAPDALVFESRVYSGLDALREGAFGLGTLSLAGLVWAANIPLWLSWVTVVAGNWRWSRWLAVIASGLGLLIFVLFAVEQPIHGPFASPERLVALGTGAWYWLAAIGLTLAAAAALYLERRAVVQTASA